MMFRQRLKIIDPIIRLETLILPLAGIFNKGAQRVLTTRTELIDQPYLNVIARQKEEIALISFKGCERFAVFLCGANSAVATHQSVINNKQRVSYNPF